jgi:type I restriction enzyme S subunit
LLLAQLTWHLGLGRFQRLPFPLPPVQVQEVLGELVRAAQTEIDYARARLRSAESYAIALIERVRDFVILGGIVSLTSDDRPILRREWVWRTTSDIVPEDAPIVYGILQPGPNITDGT